MKFFLPTPEKTIDETFVCEIVFMFNFIIAFKLKLNDVCFVAEVTAVIIVLKWVVYWESIFISM